MGGRRLNISVSSYGQVAGCCGYGNEHFNMFHITCINLLAPEFYI